MPEDPTLDDRGRWIGRQSWHDLLFAHWPVPARELRALVPRDLELDLWYGQGWIGVVPFRIEGPTDLLELSVRTYVRVGDVPGIYFFSLDASSPLAVLGARSLLGLRHRTAEMSFERDDEWIEYRSRGRRGSACFEARYRSVGFGEPAAPGSLEEFLVERYSLFAVRGAAVSRIEIEHPPWKLRLAQAEIRVNTMADALGIELPPQEPLLHFADRQDVLTTLPSRTPSGAGAA